MKKLLLISLMLVLLSFSSLGKSADILSDSRDKDIIVIRIIDFESPAKLGEPFNFQYYLRDISGIGDKVIVDFWIEKNGKEVTSGSDNFYLSDASNDTIYSEIFLPSDVESGTYIFRIIARHQNYASESYRTIEINVKNGLAMINSDYSGGGG